MAGARLREQVRGYLRGHVEGHPTLLGIAVLGDKDEKSVEGAELLTR